MLKTFEKFNKLFALIIAKVYHTEGVQKWAQNFVFNWFNMSQKSRQKIRHSLTPILWTSLLFCFTNFALSLYLYVESQNHELEVLEKYLGNVTQNLSVNFLDIGQGDSIFINTPTGNSLLIDSGPAGGKALGQLSSAKNFFDKKIDMVLITHTDSDHIGSMKDVVKKYNAQSFAESGVTSGTKIYDSLKDFILSKNIQQIELIRGMKIILEQGGKTMHIDFQDSQNMPDIYFEVLFPTFLYQIENYEKCMGVSMESDFRNKLFRTCKKFLKLETNENSIVGRLVYGSTTFMLTGDAPIEVEKYIVEQDKRVRAHISYATPSLTSVSSIKSNVLKLGHHGSRTSTSDIFLEYVQPEFAVISSGIKNRYGHPHSEVLDRLEKYFSTTSLIKNSQNYLSSHVLRTDEHGTIIFESDGSNLQVFGQSVNIQ